MSTKNSVFSAVLNLTSVSARHGLVALGVLLFGLGPGALGYHFIAHLAWIAIRSSTNQ
jgi:hypothetical protein